MQFTRFLAEFWPRPASAPALALTLAKRGKRGKRRKRGVAPGPTQSALAEHIAI
jgi:hypothetical protein